MRDCEGIPHVLLQDDEGERESEDDDLDSGLLAAHRLGVSLSLQGNSTSSCLHGISEIAYD